MRDFVIVAIVFGVIPFVLSKPHIGILLWSWIGYMNPHKLAWGWAQNFPLAEAAALATFAGLVFSSEKTQFRFERVVGWWLAYIAFMTLATVFALYPEEAWVQWEKVLKIQLVALLTLGLITNRQRLGQLVWVIAFSLGFFGAKGGLYILRTGGDTGKVWGPPGSFIAGNNELALALVMTLPLLFFLRRWEHRRWIKLGLTGAIGLTVVAILGSFSRGALLALLACGAFLGWKSGRKRPVVAAAAIGLVTATMLMPQSWWDRMGTIKTYDQDTSATGRLDAWRLAIDVASARPFGGGFECFNAETYLRYSAAFIRPQDAHSIYFEVLGEQGWIGLALFLALFFSAWFRGSALLRKTADSPEFEWERDLIRMIQVSLVGYAVGGAFLGLAYFDLPYHLIGMIVIVAGIVSRTADRRAGSPAPARRPKRV